MEYSNLSGMDSVTQVLSAYVDSQWFKEEHAYRGSAVHLALRNHLLGIWQTPIHERFQGFFDSGRRWADSNIEKVLLVEDGNKTRMSDPCHRYSGQPDLICTLKHNPKPGITDWKTSKAFSVVWAGQCAGYWNLAKINGFPDVDWACTVRLREDGRKAIHNYIQNLPVELQYFLNANAAYRRYKLKIV